MKPTLAITTVDELRHAVRAARQRGLIIGMVPTMGSLHAGHASLIRAARKETGFVVVSIFVNPAQFGPHEDFDRYPRPLEHDLALCGQEGADLVFAPEVKTVYPPGFHTFVEIGGLGDVLCGPLRPNHFRGVATVVLKLFNMVQPDVAYFGQKDFQQSRIIQETVRDLDVPVSVVVCPTVREPDGLALSSRNQYLSADQRRQATVLWRALTAVRDRIQSGERDAARLRLLMCTMIAATPGAVLDYAQLVDADTLQTVDRLKGNILVALAVKFGATRLIDNLVVEIGT